MILYTEFTVDNFDKRYNVKYCSLDMLKPVSVDYTTGWREGGVDICDIISDAGSRVV